MLRRTRDSARLAPERAHHIVDPAVAAAHQVQPGPRRVGPPDRETAVRQEAVTVASVLENAVSTGQALCLVSSKPCACGFLVCQIALCLRYQTIQLGFLVRRIALLFHFPTSRRLVFRRSSREASGGYRSRVYQRPVALTTSGIAQRAFDDPRSAGRSARTVDPAGTMRAAAPPQPQISTSTSTGLLGFRRGRGILHSPSTGDRDLPSTVTELTWLDPLACRKRKR